MHYCCASFLVDSAAGSYQTDRHEESFKYLVKLLVSSCWLEKLFLRVLLLVTHIAAPVFSVALCSNDRVSEFELVRPFLWPAKWTFFQAIRCFDQLRHDERERGEKKSFVFGVAIPFRRPLWWRSRIWSGLTVWNLLDPSAFCFSLMTHCRALSLSLFE